MAERGILIARRGTKRSRRSRTNFFLTILIVHRPTTTTHTSHLQPSPTSTLPILLLASSLAIPRDPQLLALHKIHHGSTAHTDAVHPAYALWIRVRAGLELPDRLAGGQHVHVQTSSTARLAVVPPSRAYLQSSRLLPQPQHARRTPSPTHTAVLPRLPSIRVRRSPTDHTRSPHRTLHPRSLLPSGVSTPLVCREVTRCAPPAESHKGAVQPHRGTAGMGRQGAQPQR